MSRKVFTFAALLLVLATMAFGQGRDVVTFLEQTDEVLAEAEARFDGASEEAVAMYEEAVALQEEAWELYDGGDSEAAFMTSRNARRLLGNAIRLLCEEPREIDTERVLDMLTSNDALIEELATPVEEAASDPITEMYEHAIELNTDAHAAYEAGEYEEALNLGRTAHQLLNRVDHLLEADCPGTPDIDEARVLEALEATDAFIEEVTPIIEEDGSEEAVELLATANEMQTDAYAAYEDGDYTSALRLTNNARRLASRAARFCDGDRPVPGGEDGSGHGHGGDVPGPGDLDEETVLAELEITDDFIADTEEALEDTDVEEAVIILERANEVQGLAWEAYDDGSLRMALNQTMNARRLAQNALRVAEGGVPTPGGE